MGYTVNSRSELHRDAASKNETKQKVLGEGVGPCILHREINHFRSSSRPEEGAAATRFPGGSSSHLEEKDHPRSQLWWAPERPQAAKGPHHLPKLQECCVPATSCPPPSTSLPAGTRGSRPCRPRWGLNSQSTAGALPVFPQRPERPEAAGNPDRQPLS